mgnify:CR=1 FL=1
MAKKFNHAFDLAFEVISNQEDGEDVTPEMLKEGLLKRIENMDLANEWLEACGGPFDTHVEGK